MMKFFTKVITFILKVLDFLKPIGDLAARLWVAEIFLRAGILKIMNWGSTLYLFENEFRVPFLSPTLAAYIGTGAEIILPILLILGLGGRISILIFFLYNAIAVISYPHLWTPEGTAGLKQHINWGLLLALLMFHGPGKISLDYLLHKKYGEYFKNLT